MKPFLILLVLISFTLTQVRAINPIDQNPIKKSQSKAHTPLSKLSKSDSILFQFLKLYVKDTAVKKVLYIDGKQLKLNDSLTQFAIKNNYTLVLNSIFYSPNNIINYQDSFMNQTLPCTVLRFYENIFETEITIGHYDITIEFAVIGLGGHLDTKTYIWNQTTKTFSIKE